jgi:hypothetical protein
MKTTTTKYTTPLYVKDGSPEADFVQRFEGCLTSVWVFLDDNGLFFEHPQLKADWQEMEQCWIKRPFLRSPPRRRAHLSCRVLYRVFR